MFAPPSPPSLPPGAGKKAALNTGVVEGDDSDAVSASVFTSAPLVVGLCTAVVFSVPIASLKGAW
jgi:hypothetical protein